MVSPTSHAGLYPANSSFDLSALRGGLLIVPAVSLANLPQLAVDLIISSLSLPFVGHVGDGRTVVPFAGAAEDGERIIGGGLELYGSKKAGASTVGESVKGNGADADGGVWLLQQHSPVLKSEKEEHVELLATFIRSVEWGAVLLLASIDAANQDDETLLTPHQSLLPPAPPSSSHNSPIIARLSSLPPLPSSPLSPPTYPPFLPSAGLTRRLLSALHQSKPFASPHGTILAWCVEGDNRGDAHALAEQVLRVAGLDVETVQGPGGRLKEPESWKGLFGATEGWSGGRGNNAELYG